MTAATLNGQLRRSRSKRAQHQPPGSQPRRQNAFLPGILSTDRLLHARRELNQPLRRVFALTAHGMARRWVYDHAGDLGAVPLGSGSMPRLGFHPARVRQYLDRSVADPPPLPMPVPYYAKPRRSRQREKTDAVRRLLGEIPLYP